MVDSDVVKGNIELEVLAINVLSTISMKSPGGHSRKLLKYPSLLWQVV